MATRTLKITISGRGPGTDAPTADDFLDQVRDYLDILREVEGAVASDGQIAIDWRIVDAGKNSPLQLEIGAFPRTYATNIDQRVAVVASATARGLAELQAMPRRPLYFNDRALAKAENTFERVANGLNLSDIDFGPSLPRLEVRPAIARSAARNAGLALRPAEKPYRELGTVEGYSRKVERDGYGRRVLYVKHRLTGNDVKCILSGEAVRKIEDHFIGDVFKSIRIVVVGTIYYRAIGRIRQVEANDVRFPRSSDELPSVDDITDPTFTDGFRTEEYLGRLRDGDLS